MTVYEFWDGIGLSQKHRTQVQKYNYEERECTRLCELYQKDHGQFFEKVLEKENSSLWFLWIYSFMACKVFEKYREANIAEEIFWDTFLDIRFWCENAEKEFGIMGLMEYEWFYRHIDMVLFRLGRLQFEKTEGKDEVIWKEMIDRKVSVIEKDICDKEDGVYFEKISKMKSDFRILNIHIPQGEPLVWEECKKSLLMAERFWGKDTIFVCHSWLLYPGLEPLLEKNPNIKEFRRHFTIVETDYREREAEWRVFGKILKNVIDYPQITSLQKQMKEELLTGKTFGNGWGILKIQGLLQNVS